MRYLESGCTPLGFWTEQDVLEYSRRFNVPISKDYGLYCLDGSMNARSKIIDSEVRSMDHMEKKQSEKLLNLRLSEEALKLEIENAIQERESCLKSARELEFKTREFKTRANQLEISITDKKKLFLIEKEIDFTRNVLGLDETSRDLFVVFTQKAEFVKTVDYKKEFSNFQAFEDWLKSMKLYAHNSESFSSRGPAWYDMGLSGQLENLGWEFSKSGHLKNCNW